MNSSIIFPFFYSVYFCLTFDPLELWILKSATELKFPYHLRNSGVVFDKAAERVLLMVSRLLFRDPCFDHRIACSILLEGEDARLVIFELRELNKNKAIAQVISNISRFFMM